MVSSICSLGFRRELSFDLSPECRAKHSWEMAQGWDQLRSVALAPRSSLLESATAMAAVASDQRRVQNRQIVPDELLVIVHLATDQRFLKGDF